MDDHVDARSLLTPPLPRSAGTVRRGRTGGHGRLITVVLILLLAVAGGATLWKMRGAPIVHYVTMPATRGAIARRVIATGAVNPQLTIIVGSYVSGVIQQLSCDYNTQVKAGQSCAKIDPRPYQTIVDQDKADLAVAKAQLEKDQANLTYAKLNNERNSQLVKEHAVSQDAADVAKNSYNQAQAQIDVDRATIEQRQAALEAAQVNLDYTDIVSPVDGTVVSRNVTRGQTVAASFQTPTLFLIASDLTKMQVDTNVSESDIGGVKEGDKATFTVDAFPDRIFDGTVTQVRQSPQSVQNVVTFDAVVSVDNRDLALKPGMTASTQIVVDQRNDVLRVPSQALRYAPGGLAGVGASEMGASSGAGARTGPISRLWVLRGGQPVAVNVAPGLDDETFTEIVKGNLKTGDEVVVGDDRGSTGGQPAPTPQSF